MSHWFTSGDNAGDIAGYAAAIVGVMNRHGGTLARLDEVRAQTIKTLTTAFLLDGASASSALSAAKTVVSEYELGLHTLNATDYEDYKSRKALLRDEGEGRI